jgi:hypothetical protein
MAKPLNFNSWVKTQRQHQLDTGAAVTPLAPVWQAKRGRMTRDSVEKRATMQYNMSPGVGYAAWDAFILAQGRTNSADSPAT